MLKLLPGPLRGLLSLSLYVLNTIFWVIPIFFIALLKILLPLPAWRRWCNHVLNSIAVNWIGVNNFNQKLFGDTRLDIIGTNALKPRGWYLVIANHQSWVDILVLQRVFHRKIPFLKFFIKKELFWVPLLGQAWWALDFPFMKRYSKKFLARHPHLKGKDIEITRRACEKFKTLPVSIMNFVEGTRFTPTKHRHQQSPYDNLLKTKAGGIAFVLAAMGDHLNHILDVTIVYPAGVKSFWSFACGNIKAIKVHIKELPVNQAPSGDYVQDPEFRRAFQNWLNGLWGQKDKCIDDLLART
jgi:1-acyl-sn-glycerol-3-phosphate acyltransferase